MSDDVIPAVAGATVVFVAVLGILGSLLYEGGAKNARNQLRDCLQHATPEACLKIAGVTK
jgi:hypothetical protein